MKYKSAYHIIQQNLELFKCYNYDNKDTYHSCSSCNNGIIWFLDANSLIKIILRSSKRKQK